MSDTSMQVFVNRSMVSSLNIFILSTSQMSVNQKREIQLKSMYIAIILFNFMFFFSRHSCVDCIESIKCRDEREYWIIYRRMGRFGNEKKTHLDDFIDFDLSKWKCLDLWVELSSHLSILSLILCVMIKDFELDVDVIFFFLFSLSVDLISIFV